MKFETAMLVSGMPQIRQRKSLDSHSDIANVIVAKDHLAEKATHHLAELPPWHFTDVLEKIDRISRVRCQNILIVQPCRNRMHTLLVSCLKSEPLMTFGSAHHG